MILLYNKKRDYQQCKVNPNIQIMIVIFAKELLPNNHTMKRSLEGILKIYMKENR